MAVICDKNSESNKRFDENCIFNILKRLEADTLYDLRVVCKQWNNLISCDPYFAHSNLSYHALPGLMIQSASRDFFLGLMEMKEGGDIVFKKLRMCFANPIRSSCNGLVVMQDFPNFGDMSVGNFFTKKGTKLPLNTCSDLLFLLCVYGFTYIKETAKYKIVCQMFDGSTRSVVYMIFTLGSNEWRQVKEWPSSQSVWFLDQTESRPPVSTDGFLHKLSFEDGHDYLFSVDTREETCHKTTLPFSKLASGPHYLMDIVGILSSLSFNNNNAVLQVWVLPDFYKKEWIIQHCISLLHFPTIDPQISLEPMGILGNGKVIVFADTRPKCLGCYIFDVDLQEVVMEFPDFHCEAQLSIPHFHKSLVSSQVAGDDHFHIWFPANNWFEDRFAIAFKYSDRNSLSSSF